MINPSSLLNDNAPYVYTLHASSCSGLQTLGLHASRKYTIAHDGLNPVGGADTTVIFVATSGNPIWVSDPNQVVGQVRLTGSRAIEIGPGLQTIRYISLAGQPTFTIVPSETLRY